MNLRHLRASATVLAILAARPLAPPGMRRGGDGRRCSALLVVAPFVSSSTSILFDALTAMCVAYGWNIIGGFTGYASFGNVAYLGLGAFVAAGLHEPAAGPPGLALVRRHPAGRRHRLAGGWR